MTNSIIKKFTTKNNDHVDKRNIVRAQDDGETCKPHQDSLEGESSKTRKNLRVGD